MKLAVLAALITCNSRRHCSPSS